MAFGLTIGTERATALQNSIQGELTKRGFSADADPVMAEYITIMIINNKTPEQISSELEDLIGSDFDRSFTDWLFAEAAKGAPEPEGSPATQVPAIPVPAPATASSEPSSNREAPPHLPSDPSRRPPNGPRQGAPPLYQQALSQISPGQKRTASARSPSPPGFQPNKSRRTEPPSGPRAMAQGQGPRSLLERMGGRANRAANGRMNDEIQARIDNITARSPEPNVIMGGAPGAFPGGMDMNAVMAMGNPLMLQEMMMNQMALMTQMAGAMGILNPNPAQFMNGAFPPGMTPEMFAQMQGMQQQMGNMGNGQAQRGGRPTRGRGGKRGGFAGPVDGAASEGAAPAPAPAIVAPTPQTAVPAVAAPVVAPVPVPSTSVTYTSSRAGFVVPERPQSPTLCKFALKCTNPLCRYSHPSPVATPESGVVLSNEACEAGKNCKDKDCIKAHVSPATLTAADTINPKPRPYVHPTRPGPDKGHFAQPCRFGAGCTRATCPFQHPEGRVLPNSFHKGLSSSAPVINVHTPETGSIGGPSPHRSVTFNKGNTAEELEKRMKELEERKSQAEAAVKRAEAAAASKKDENKPVPVAS